MELVASGPCRLEPTAIPGQRLKGGRALGLSVRIMRGFECRNESEHFLGLGLGKGAYFVVDALGSAHNE